MIGVGMELLSITLEYHYSIHSNERQTTFLSQETYLSLSKEWMSDLKSSELEGFHFLQTVREWMYGSPPPPPPSCSGVWVT